jgi:hypothetical protein
MALWIWLEKAKVAKVANSSVCGFGDLARKLGDLRQKLATFAHSLATFGHKVATLPLILAVLIAFFGDLRRKVGDLAPP